MKLSMMTLGCPAWDMATICRQARAFGYDGIDFRGIGDALDVTALPAFTTDARSTVRMLGDHGLVVSGISSSIHLCAADRRGESLEEARRTIDAATNVGAVHVRVFGEGRPDEIGFASAAVAGADCARAILELPGAKQLSWNFETHDHWVRIDDCRRLLDAVTDPEFGVAWDIAHTERTAGERAGQTLDALGDRLRYVHVKDAVRAPGHPDAMPDGWRYVLPGRGEIRLVDAVDALRQRGYDGWLMFEHEKRWHPELEAPERALPAFVQWAERAGVR